MSFLYRIVENFCYRSNRSANGGIKGRMEKSLLTSDGTERPPFWCSLFTHMSKTDSHGCDLYRYTPKNRTSDKVVLFLHGGGGMSRPTSLHYDLVCRLVRKTGSTVYMPFYPLAPRYNVRQALDYLEKLYADLLSEYGPQNIIFMGDSAGANLILSLADRSAEKPAGLVVISPAYGIEDGTPRDIRLQYEDKDPILSVKMNDSIRDNWCRSVPLNDRDISPEYVDYSKLPGMLFVYGTHELFYPLVVKVTEGLAEKREDVTLFVRDACHDFALCSFFAEGRQAQREIFRFVTERRQKTT